ncbi:Na/Pi cotransporter family protein [Oceanicella actignis]|nr:Na/Pi cotransporter family protein [Oceanicella actignis]
MRRRFGIVGFALHLAGAVALLLWAVRMIRTGVERGFMPQLRAALRSANGGSLRAAILGVPAALALQSSTAVAILAAGFVSAGALAGRAGLAMTLGADVGSALTARLYSLPVSALTAPLLLLGVALFMNARNRPMKQAGRMLIGLGLAFVALAMIREATAPLRDSPIVNVIIGYLSSDLVGAFVLGALLAWAMHSSLAAVLTFVAFASHDMLPAQAAGAMTLGANLGGAAIPAVLTLAAPSAARQIILANLLFRGGGAMIALAALAFLEHELARLGPTAAEQVLNLHLAFNLAVALLALPLAGGALRLAAIMAPDRGTAPGPARISNLDPSVLDSPDLALGCARRELLRMGEMVHAMLAPVLGLCSKWDDEVAGFIAEAEDQVDRMHFDIKLYVAKLQRERLTDAQSRRAMEIAAMANSFEDAADQISTQMLAIARRLNNEGRRFSDAGLKDLTALHDRVLGNVQLALNLLLSGDVESARHLIEEKDAIREMEKELQARHLARLRDSSASVETSNLHQEMLRALKQVHSAVCIVAYSIVEDAGELLPSRLAGARDAGA